MRMAPPSPPARCQSRRTVWSAMSKEAAASKEAATQSKKADAVEEMRAKRTIKADAVEGVRAKRSTVVPDSCARWSYGSLCPVRFQAAVVQLLPEPPAFNLFGAQRAKRCDKPPVQ